MAVIILEQPDFVHRPMLDFVAIHPLETQRGGWIVDPLPPVPINAPLAAVPEPEWSAVLVCMGLIVLVAWRAFKSSNNRRGVR